MSTEGEDSVKMNNSLEKEEATPQDEEHSVTDVGDSLYTDQAKQNSDSATENKLPVIDVSGEDNSNESETNCKTGTPPTPKTSSDWVVVDREKAEDQSSGQPSTGPQFPTSDRSENTSSSTDQQQNTCDNQDITSDSISKGPEKKQEEWTYVLGHKKLMKKTLTDGNGTRPVAGQIVSVRCCGVTDDGMKVDNHDSLTFTVQDGDVIQALDLCVALMELHEVAEIVTEPQYAYGVRGRSPDIPSNAKLTYTVELLVIEDKPDYNSLSIFRRIQDGDAKRTRGNQLYEREEYTAAINSYMKALSILDDSHQSHEEEATELQRLLDCRLKCFNNLAATQVKVEAWDSAIKSCDDVLKVQPENVKALFRKGKSLAGKGDIDRAISVLRKAMKLEPETKIIHQELSRLVAKHKQQSQSEKDLYKKMLGTDKEKTIPKNDNSRWLMYLGGAIGTVLVSVGVAYRYLHTQ